MGTYAWRIRATHGANIGNIVYNFHVKDLMYFNANRRVNRTSFCEGIISVPRSRHLEDAFDVENNGDKLDYLIEVFRQPRDVRGGRIGAMDIFEVYLLRYSRVENLNDGRLRITFIGRSLLDLLRRPIVYPDLVLPFLSNTDPNQVAIAEAAFPFPVPGAETYEGVAGADTKLQMEELYAHCRINTPEPLAIIDPIVPVAGGGIPDHPVALRFDNMLHALQDMSAASWYASFYGIDGTVTPVDFDVTLNAGSPNVTFPFQFQTFVGGRGLDRTIGNGVNPVQIFSDQLDNVIQPVSIRDRRFELTEVLVAGQGQGVARDLIRIRNTQRAADSPYNLSSKQIGNGKLPAFPGGIRTAHDVAWRSLREDGFRQDITVIPRNAGTAVLGLDWSLGDLVSVRYQGDVINRQVSLVDIKLFNHPSNRTGSGGSGTHEQISLQLRSLDGRDAEGLRSFQSVLGILYDRDEETERRLADVTTD